MPFDKARSVALAQQVFELRLAGHSMDAVAETLGVSRATCYREFDYWIRELVTPKADEARTLELARLDRLLVALDPAIHRGDVRAIGEARAISQRRSDLLGLNMPTKVEHKVQVLDAVDEEIMRLTAQLGEPVREVES
jgi:hypothetical protein